MLTLSPSSPCPLIRHAWKRGLEELPVNRVEDEGQHGRTPLIDLGRIGGLLFQDVFVGTPKTVRSEFFMCHGTPPTARQCWLPPAIGSSGLAARLERLRLMTQLYVGTRPIPKGIGRVIRRFVMFAFHVPSPRLRTLIASGDDRLI